MKKSMAAAVAALLLAGCTGETGNLEPTQTTTATPTTSPTESPTTATTTPTPEPAPEEAAAQQAVIDFWKMRDELGIDPELSVTRLSEVARGQALDVHRRALIDQAREGLRQVGSGVVTPTSATPGPEEDQMIVTACLDVANVDVVDSAVESIVPATRPDRVAYDYTVENGGDRWYVIEDLLEAKAC